MDVVFEGSKNRIRNCALELLSIGDDISDDDDSWDIITTDLQLKSTFMYCDFTRMISRAPQDLKMPLTQLADELLCSIEELIGAVSSKSISQFYDRYDEVAEISQEVVTLLMPSDTDFEFQASSIDSEIENNDNIL